MKDEILREKLNNLSSQQLEWINEYCVNDMSKLKKIIPHDFMGMLQAIAQMEEKGLSNEQAQIEAFYQLKKAR